MCAQIVRNCDQDGSPRGAVPARALPYPNRNLDRFPRGCCRPFSAYLQAAAAAFLYLVLSRRGGFPRRMLLSGRGLAWLRHRGRPLTRDEENRAFRSLEQFCRNLTEEKLLARPPAYADQQEIVTTDLELAENGFLRRADATHRAFDLDSIRIAHPDDLADDGVGAGRWCECGADVAPP